jgi:hypothetical protein
MGMAASVESDPRKLAPPHTGLPPSIYRVNIEEPASGVREDGRSAELDVAAGL